MIPAYVQKLPEQERKNWATVYQEFQPQGDDVALYAANTWLQKHITRVSAIALTSKRERKVLRFEVNTSKEFITRTDSGEEYISAMLTDVLENVDGSPLPIELLRKWAERINAGEAILGDIDHEEYKRIMSEGLSEAEVKALLRSKPSIAKSVKAVVQDGVLWLQAVVDKRYKNAIKKAKGVSIEAIIETDERTGRVVDGDLVGFTFAVNEDLGNPRAQLYA